MTMGKKQEPKPVTIYSIEEIRHPNGTVELRRVNHGVDAHRLHSILMFATNDVARQISRDLPPPVRIYMDKKLK